jgi:opacity protein-like surface antigen
MTGSGGSGLSVDNDLGYGFTLNYNLTNHFALGGDLTFSNPDYQAKRVIDGTNTVVSVNATLDVSTIHFKGTYYFGEGKIAPYVEGGAGWTHVDSNIVDGAPTTGCWWDPWWGYICTSFYDTYTETRTSYSYGVGLRWDITDEFVARASYGLLEIDTAHETDAELDVIRVDFAWRF